MNTLIRNFVDINIVSKSTNLRTGTRKKVGILFTEGSGSTTTVTVTSKAEADAIFPATTYAKLNAYLTVFFNAGGLEVVCKGPVSVAPSSAADFSALINSFDNDVIVVAYAPSSYTSTIYANLKAVAVARAADTSIYGINEKILLARYVDTTVDTTSVKNFAVQRSSVDGAEMLIAAYLSQIDVTRKDVVEDYCFTSLDDAFAIEAGTEIDNMLTSNINVGVKLAGLTRNVAGYMKDGSNLVNDYLKIILQQDLTNAILLELVQGIKGERGMSRISSVMSATLSKYVDCGYLVTDKIWTDNDLSVSYDGNTYVIIEKNTQLTSGYYISILPVSVLTAADRAAHKAPPIYLIIADQYGIHKVTVNGYAI